MRLMAASLVGVGLGGLFDGIVLHQILQWHHLVSTQMPVVDLASLEANTLADGVFHQAMWLVTVAGVALLYVEMARPDRVARGTFLGGALIGWGSFNVADEVVFHVALDLHHIRPGPDVVLWDLAFTTWGLGMVAVGLVLLGRAR